MIGQPQLQAQLEGAGGERGAGGQACRHTDLFLVRLRLGVIEKWRQRYSEIDGHRKKRETERQRYRETE